MPNVGFISPKGGAGKTTAALLLALGLAERGSQVAVVDSDPNRPLVRWAELAGHPRSITVHAAPTVQDIRDAVREAQRYRPDWLIVDTEGTERGAMVFAAVQFHLVITPLSGSHLDLAETIKAAQIVGTFGRRASRPLVHRALLTRIPPMIKPRTLTKVVEALRTADLPILPTPLVEKEAFRALFAAPGGFDELQEDGVWGVEAARLNMRSYVEDVIGVVAASSPTVAQA